MNNSEKLFIDSVIEILEDSKKTDWTNGTFDKWHKFAVSMQNGINRGVHMLKKFRDNEDSIETIKHAKEEPLSDLDKLEKLL